MFKEIKNQKQLILYIVAQSFIVIFGMHYFKYADSICILMDEFGYWTGAAFLSGTDWSGATAVCPYYGYGYGVLLLPCLKIFFNSPDLMYKSALWLNIILVLVCFNCCLFILMKNKLDVKNAIFSSLAVSFFPSNMIYLQLTLSEVLLTTLVWLIVLCMIVSNNKIASIKWGLAIVLSVFSISVHMRSLVIILSLIFCLILYSISNKKIKNIFIFMLISFALCILLFSIKNVYEDYLHGKIVAQNFVDQNDFAYRISHLTSFVSKEGGIKALKSLVGKVIYIIISTYGIAPIGMIYCLENVIIDIRKRKVENKNLIYFFSLIAFLGALAIGVVSTAWFPNRLEGLLYGRYIDYLTYPFILFGMIYLYQCYQRQQTNRVLKMLGIELIFSYIFMFFLYEEFAIGDYSNMWCKAAGIADVFAINKVGLQEGILLLYVRFFVVILFLVLCIRKHKNSAIYCGLFIVWLVSAITISNDVIDWRTIVSENRSKAYEIVKEKEVSAFKCDERIGFLQFIFPHKYIQEVSYQEITDDVVVVTHRSNKSELAVLPEVKILGESDLLIFWEIEDE